MSWTFSVYCRERRVPLLLLGGANERIVVAVDDSTRLVSGQSLSAQKEAQILIMFSFLSAPALLSKVEFSSIFIIVYS